LTSTIYDLKKFLINYSINIDTNILLNDKILGIGSLSNSKTDQLTFYDDLKIKRNIIINTNAKGCFIRKQFINKLPTNCHPIIVDDPYLAFAYTTKFFYHNSLDDIYLKEKNKLNDNINISAKALVFDKSLIRNNTSIQKKTIIHHNSVIGPNVKIGSSTIIEPNTTISNCTIGNDCLIKSGTVIGGQGFGFTLKDKVKIIHIGDVKIGNNVEIGSNTTIDRASLDSTIISDNVRIDNLVHIAHGVFIGEHTIIAAQTGIAGSAIIGKNCIMGGQVGITGHIKIGDNVIIAAKSGVTKNIPDNSRIAGFPAIDLKLWKKQIIKQYKNQ